MGTEKQRLYGIDAFRVLAFAAVTILHAFQPQSHGVEFDGGFTFLWRWAVPFFFVTSGYFFGVSNPETIRAILKLAGRLLPVLIFWLVFYLLFFGRIGDIAHPKLIAHDVISGGPAFHLWFFFALGTSAAGVLILRHLGWQALLAAGLVLFLIGLAFGPYRDFLSLPRIPYPTGGGFKTRWGPFLGFILVALGYCAGRYRLKLPMVAGIAMALGGFVLQIAEAYLIALNGNDFAPYDYLFGTVFFGFGMFVVALNLPDNRVVRGIAYLGPVALGAYCIHLAFLELLRGYFDQNYIPSSLLLASLVFVLSLGSSFGLSKVPLLSRVVR